MYYNGTFIGYREEEGGPILPFHVDCIDWDGDTSHLYDEDGDLYENYYEDAEYNDYSESAYGRLSFSGTLYTNGGGAARRITVSGFYNPKLVFENPRLGHVNLRGDRDQWVWATYVPTRSVKKGLSQNRVNFSLTHSAVFSIFEDYYKPQVERDFRLDAGNFIHYRCGVVVGKKEGEVVTLVPLASYLKRSIEELYPECQIVLAEI